MGAWGLPAGGQGQGGATLASPRPTTGAPRHSKCKARCAWVSDLQVVSRHDHLRAAREQGGPRAVLDLQGHVSDMSWKAASGQVRVPAVPRRRVRALARRGSPRFAEIAPRLPRAAAGRRVERANLGKSRVLSGNLGPSRARSPSRCYPTQQPARACHSPSRGRSRSCTATSGRSCRRSAPCPGVEGGAHRCTRRSQRSRA